MGLILCGAERRRGAQFVNRRYEILCETLRGFHASLGRGDSCTQCQSQSCAQRTTLLSVGSLGPQRSGSPSHYGKGLGVRFRVLPRPFFSRERRPAASRLVGEGSAIQEASLPRHPRHFFSSLSLCCPFLRHSEQSEETRSAALRHSVARIAEPRKVEFSNLDPRPHRGRGLSLTGRGEGRAGTSHASAAPSPAGRDAAGRLFREITGEVGRKA